MENEIIFKVRPATRIGGYVFALISLLLVLVLVTNWQIDEPNELYWVIGMLIFYSSIGSYLIVISLTYKLVISNTKLIQVYPFKKSVILNWADIDSINFRISNGLITIHGNKKKIKLSRAIGNINKAFNLILDKVGKDKIVFDS